ncbi:hypothetical protein PBCVIL52s1_547R [Paramecium bursaria Chlorella virus IL-5-2s1]|nr:hypothetical protein PBCVIL52s1_547R [Paramecium bursaria Chlorella virus IL-5-2s1]
MDPDEFAQFWKQNLLFEEKAKLYYEKVDHIVDDKGGYRPVLFDEYRKYTFRYFKKDGEHEIFDDYTIDTNKKIDRKDGTRAPTPYIMNGYMYIVVSKNGERYTRSIARAMLSTFLGPPPDLTFTADHIESENKLDDDLANLRWLNESGQKNNRIISKTRKDARLIVNDLFPEDELTAKEWSELLLNPDGTKYHHTTFLNWAQNKENRFSYKIYDDLVDPGDPGDPKKKEEWKIYGDPNKNHIEISNKNRVKDVTFSEAGYKEEHVRTAEKLYLMGGYPSKNIDDKNHYLHVLVFQLWYPDMWKNRNEDDMVLHKHDNRLDFRPENLRLGPPSDNTKDAHDNGKYDGTKTTRQSCIAYKYDKIVEPFKSINEAAKYLVENVKENGKKLTFDAAHIGIRRALKKEKSYKGFTWKRA